MQHESKETELAFARNRAYWTTEETNQRSARKKAWNATNTPEELPEERHPSSRKHHKTQGCERALSTRGSERVRACTLCHWCTTLLLWELHLMNSYI